MARIRNSSKKNFYGDGYEQILTTDDGKSYTIKNSSQNNFYGTGKEKIVVENTGNDFAEVISDWLVNSSPKFIRIPVNILCITFAIGVLVVFLYAIIQILSLFV